MERRYARRGHPAYEAPIEADTPIDLFVNQLTGEIVLRLAPRPGVVSVAVEMDIEAARYFSDQVKAAVDDAEARAKIYATLSNRSGLN